MIAANCPGGGIALLAFVFALGAAQAAPALTGREIVEKADKANRARDEMVESIMYLISPGGQQRVRKMVTWSKSGEGDDDMILIRFLAPPDIKDTGLLTIEEGGRDNQLLYLPELRRSKRLAGASKAASFVGSDFSNYDMRTEDLANHDYELLGEEAVEGRPCYKVVARPRTEQTREESGYARRILWIDKERWVPVKVEYFDRNDRPLKVLVASDYKQIQGLWRAHRIEVRNLQQGSKTILIQNPERKINQGLPDSHFSRRSLENP
ncbi:MAG: hypothetical protein KatS3mg102_1839 [Planctomycetota bacterium]|nr:MAG: hypothetical protein KatS3mg102_1839 [Planctomycetota bacterium]